MKIIKSTVVYLGEDTPVLFVFQSKRVYQIMYHESMAKTQKLLRDYIVDGLARQHISLTDTQINRIVRQYVVMPLTLNSF